MATAARRPGARPLGRVGAAGSAGVPGRGRAARHHPARSCCGASRGHGDTASSPARAGVGCWSSTPCSPWPPSRRPRPCELQKLESESRRPPCGSRWPRGFAGTPHGGCWRPGRWAAGCSPSSRSRPRRPRPMSWPSGTGWRWSSRRPAASTLLYDCGRMGDPSVGRRIIAPALWSCGITRIDEVILSHADQDHYNGLPDLLDRFAVGTVRIPPGFGGPANPGGRPADRRRSARGASRSGRPRRPSRGRPAGVRFAVQHPPAGWYPRGLRQRAQPRARRRLRGPPPAPDRRPRATRAHRTDRATAPRPAAGCHAGPAPRRHDPPTRLALRVGRSRGVVVSQRAVPSGSVRRPVPDRTRTSPSGGPGATGRSDCSGRTTASSRAGFWPGRIPRPRGSEDAECVAHWG